MTVTLRTATDTDHAAVNARYADIGFVPSRAGELIVIATLSGCVAGQGRVVPVDARSGELGGTYVLPDFQGRGVARRIVDFLIHHTQLSVLYCLPFGQMQNFHRLMGFVPVTQQDRVPQQVLQKHQWCNANYDKPVLLLERIGT